MNKADSTVINTVSDYRLYLRRHLYPNCSGRLIELIYSNIPNTTIMDVQFDEVESKLTIKMRKKKNPVDSSFFYPYIESILRFLYNESGIDSKVFSDQSLDQEIKSKYLALHNDLNMGSGIFGFLYNIVVEDQILYVYL